MNLVGGLNLCYYRYEDPTNQTAIQVLTYRYGLLKQTTGQLVEQL